MELACGTGNYFTRIKFHSVNYKIFPQKVPFHFLFFSFPSSHTDIFLHLLIQRWAQLLCPSAMCFFPSVSEGKIKWAAESTSQHVSFFSPRTAATLQSSKEDYEEGGESYMCL